MVCQRKTEDLRIRTALALNQSEDPRGGLNRDMVKYMGLLPSQQLVDLDQPTEESVPENLGNSSGLKRNLAPGLSTWPSVIVSNVSWYYPPVTRRQSRTIKAESFLRLLDMLFQIMDPWGCRSTLQTSKFKKYTIVSLILYF